MKRKRIFLLLTVLCMIFVLCGCGNEDKFAELDSYLARREEFVAKKKAKIALIENQISESQDTLQRMVLLDDLYDEYYTFRFDSALVCLHQLSSLAEKSGNTYFQQKSAIHLIVELATGGLYPEAQKAIANLDTTQLDQRLVPEYYYALFWAYNYFGEYTTGTPFAGKYEAKNNWLKEKYIKLTLNPRYARYMRKPEVMNHYFHGILDQAKGKYVEACYHLTLCLQQCKMNERLYAMTALSLARCYQSRGMYSEYEKYAMKAAISDVVCPLKENAALQQFALYLHKTYPNETDRADRYISISLEDARFYNNRLRMVQISNILPGIVAAYQKKLATRTHYLIATEIIVDIAFVVMICLFFTIRRKRNVIAQQQQELTKKNDEVNSLNNKLSENNDSLSALNAQLSDANKLREQQMHLFLDLCVANIGKFDGYRALVQRKIKAHQTDDLLKYSNTAMLSEQESSEFITKFDKAFLSLYPQFIEQLNALLRPDAQVEQKETDRLSPELRIMALVRLGVTESSAIATLLFYTPQTIYNYRSSMKRRAKDRTTFEDEVARISGV
jgi:hypothetical protein